jgi:hypothetical protein
MFYQDKFMHIDRQQFAQMNAAYGGEHFCIIFKAFFSKKIPYG